MKLYFLSLVNLFLLISCKKYKPAEAAFFIRTPSATVITINNKATGVFQGTESNKITDIFLYVNGQFQGIYPIGNLMPIVTNNQAVTINFFAGIRNNGISTTRIPYPCYDYVTIADTLVQSGKTIERPISFKYGSGVTFDLLEDFEPNKGIKIMRSAVSDVSYRFATGDDNFEGRSLELDLSADSAGLNVAQIESTANLPLPAGSENVYLEINYKCNAPFSVGVIGDSDPDPKEAFDLNPQETWNKIYIQLSGVVSAPPVSTNYKIYFKMLKTTDYPDPKLFLDNIKVLHLQ